MNTQVAIDLLQNLIQMALLIVSPILGTAIFVGLMVSLFQSVTSIQEQTLTFVPKLFAVGVMLIAAGSWILRMLIEYTVQIFQLMPTMAQ